MSIGIASCFFGYRWFRIAIVVLGFVAGGFLAGFIHATVNLGSDPSPLVLRLGGVVGGVLFYYGYFIGVMLFGAALTGAVAALLSAIGSGSPQPAIVFVALLVGAWLALRFQKLVIVIATAFQGALALTMGIAFALEGGIGNPRFRWQWFSGEIAGDAGVTFLVVLVLALVGIGFQYWDTARLEGAEAADPSPAQRMIGVGASTHLAAVANRPASGDGYRQGGRPVGSPEAARRPLGRQHPTSCKACGERLSPMDIEARVCPNCRITLEAGTSS